MYSLREEEENLPPLSVYRDLEISTQPIPLPKMMTLWQLCWWNVGPVPLGYR